MYHSFLIHSSADGQLGCLCVLAIVNSAVMNIGVHVSLSILVSSVCTQQWDCWGIWEFYFQFFKESPHCSHSGCTSLQPTNSLRGFPFLHTLSSIVCRLFDDVHSDWHKMVPHSGFDFHFSNNEQCRASVYSVQFSSVTQ